MMTQKEETKMSNSSLYGNYRTRTFSDIWPDFSKFKTYYDADYLPKKITEQSLKTLYFLLYSRYGNSSIATSDENQFKAGVLATIFMYGPTWEKRLEIQDKLRALSENEILTGGSAIYNSAMNPETLPTTQTTEELNFINQQNTTKYKKSKLEGYSILMELLETDVTNEFLNRFKRLFITVVQPQEPLWYVTEGDNE